jgi:DNA topoisomerase-3
MLKKLWITEKPDVAKSLAAGLALTFSAEVTNSRDSRTDGCYKLSSGDWVTYLFGQMLEAVPPEFYLTEEQNRGDVFKYLPLNPQVIVKLPKADRVDGKFKRSANGDPIPPAQFGRVVDLIRKAPEIVNAGDIDRQGQLIVDELLMYAGVDPRGKDKPIHRLALTNNNENEIKKLVLKGLEKNSDAVWVRRYESANTRERGDWKIGMTASRAYRQATGYRQMSAGRVVTPTLSLVVARELQIERFRPVQYYVPVITLSNGVRMRWHARAGCEGKPGFDLQGRIVDESVARQIVNAIMNGMKGETTLAEAQKKFDLPPLPFSLGTLQSAVSRRHGIDLKTVTSAAQSLYERHKMITYVGTDCQFLPTSMLDAAQDTIAALSKVLPRQAGGANLTLRSKAWDDAKTDEHFAIAPTGKVSSGLSDVEKKVFDAVSRRYLAQFYPAHEYMAMRLRAMFGGDEFRAADKEVLRRGWHDAEFDHDQQVETVDGADDDGDGEQSAQRATSQGGH